MNLSRDTDIIAFPYDDDMVYTSGYVYVYFRSYNVTYEEVQNISSADGEANH